MAERAHAAGIPAPGDVSASGVGVGEDREALRRFLGRQCRVTTYSLHAMAVNEKALAL